ncbi:MAG: MATE family efflux transporter, partial [Bacillota bacterium]
PIVGFNYGARYFQRLYDVIAYTSKLLLIYFGIVFLIVMIGARYLFMIFGDPDAVPITNAVDFIEDGAMAFRIVSLGFIFITFQVILSSTYQAMGYPLRAFIVAVSRRFVFFLPFAFLLTWLVGINGIWWTFFVADLITGLGSYIVYRLEMKELKQRIASS